MQRRGEVKKEDECGYEGGEIWKAGGNAASPSVLPLHFLNLVTRQQRRQPEVHKKHIRCLINCLITLKTLINKLSDGCHREDGNASTQQRVSPTCLHLFSTYCLMCFLQRRFLTRVRWRQAFGFLQETFSSPQTKYLWPLKCLSRPIAK